MQVGLIYREGSAEARELGRKVVERLAERGAEARLLASQEPIPGAERSPEEDWSRGLALAVVLGGDGTLLRAAQLLDADIPVLGVKLGGLGFLTEVRPEELFGVLDQALEGRASVLERMALTGSIVRNGASQSFRALNEVAITCAGMPRIVDLDTNIDGVFVTSFRADGLLVCTPTGSTAYNMAAGGPIMHPALQCITITPICPHTLTSRPLVIPARSSVTVSLADNDVKSVHVSPDAQKSWPLEKGQKVEITAAARGLKLVCSPAMNYYEILRTKLRWGER
jgi:NAD+ kinase